MWTSTTACGDQINSENQKKVKKNQSKIIIKQLLFWQNCSTKLLAQTWKTFWTKTNKKNNQNTNWTQTGTSSSQTVKKTAKMSSWFL